MQQYNIEDYDTLFRKSVDDIAWFWDAVMRDLDIRFRTPYSRIVDMSDGPEFPRWCVDGEMNIIDNCLDKWQDTARADSLALKYESEAGAIRTMTYRQLYIEVNRCANALRANGLGKGDAVGLYMPMTPELIIAFLAIIKIGGIILPLFSGYGPQAIATRLNDGKAQAVFTANGYFRRGKPVEMKQTLDEALQSCPTVKRVIVLEYHDYPQSTLSDQDITWSAFLQGQNDAAVTEPVSAEDVCMIIYTSGTTGRPKGAVHTHCGFPVKAAQDMAHAMDLKPGETMYWMTDMGWMMGPWLVFGTLLIGASMVIYDGAPDFPDVDRLWALTEGHQVTHLGISPTLIRALKGHGEKPVKKHDLSTLRMAGSTGSPWDPDSWMWLFETVLEGRKPILNYSGGTEISGGIVCGNFFKPLKPCAFSGPVIGMDADVVNEEGLPVRGAVGELVIRQPWIGMTRGFRGDRERYLESYWRTFPGIWRHGDFAAIDEDGLWYILGRSDDTIKIAGKRLGPAEVEALLNAHPRVLESAAIAVPHPVKDNEVIGFVVLKDTTDDLESLRNELMERVIAGLGKALKPKAIRFCRALPKTRNAKVMRRLIRAVYLDKPVGDISSLENPDTLQAIREAR
ncbi:MAG: AMP-dependent synthetase [Calditrichaeota bacterium]|nr:MAG: AMP-dependent synthetase [Calditrichota bacterium]